MEPTDLNPYAPPVTASEQVYRPPVGYTSPWLRRLVISYCIITLLGLGFAAFEIESIIYTGPLFALNGLILAGLAYRQSHKAATLLGASAAVYALFIFLLINLLHWGPTDADAPVQIMSLAYAVVALPTAWWSFRVRASA